MKAWLFWLAAGCALWARCAQADFAGVCDPNTVVAGPIAGSGAAPSCRLLTPADLPSTTATTSNNNILLWGADPTGATDSAPAIQKAINAALGCIKFPVGVFWINAPIVATKWFCLDGNRWSENIPNTNPPYDGTWFNITSTTFNPFTINNPAARGALIRGIAIEQTHRTPAPGWTPTAYPPVFTITGALGEVTFEDIYLAGVYQGIYSYNSGRTTLRHIRGQTFSYLAFIDNPAGSDTNHIDDIHIWPYWSSDASVYAWQQANGDVFKFGRVDSVDADHIFGLGYKSCIHFAGNTTGAGPATGVHIGSLNCDASALPVWDTDTFSAPVVGYGTEAHIAELQCAATTAAGNCIQIDGKNSRLKIGSLQAVTVTQSILNVTSNSSVAGSTVRIGSLDASGGFNYSGSTPYAGTSPTFNLVSNPGFPHQVALATPMVPSNGGYTTGNVASGLVNVNTAASSAIVYDAGEQTWYNPTVTNSSTNQIPNWCTQYLPSGTSITTITYKLPDVAIDGREVTIAAAQNQTGVTITALNSIFGTSVTALTANVPVKFKFLQPILTWYRVQ